MSSLLNNALLGADLLPTSVIPLTAMPTSIRPGPKLAVRVIYQNGRPADTFDELSSKTLTGYLNSETRQELIRAPGYCREQARGRQILSQAKEMAD